MSTDNKNKYALVTGATSGIGYELAKLFAKDEYNLVIVAREESRLQEVAKEFKTSFNINVITLSKDLFKPTSAKEIYDEVKQKGIEINVLVNDAGQGEVANFIDYNIDRDVDIIQLNITSLVSLTKYFLKDMLVRNEGKILQLASQVSKAPAPLMAVYAASKAFVLSFTEALIQEIKDTEVTMTALMPPATDTDFFHKAHATETKTYKEMPFATPEEVAKAGYEALQSGDRRALPTMMNKIQTGMNDMMPDNLVAKQMKKLNSESDKKDGKSNAEHDASQKERDAIGSADGDLKIHEGHVHN